MSTPVKRTVTGEPVRAKSTAGRKLLKSTKKQIKDAVYKELSKQLELKNCVNDYSNIPINRAIPSGVVFNAQGNFFRLLPQIQQSTTGAAGAAYNERIGNSISLKHIDIHGFLTYANAKTQEIDLVNAKLAVRVMILRAKEVNDIGVLFDNMPTDVLLRQGFDAGTGGPAPYSGFVLDSFREINRDAFSVRHDEVYYLNSPVITPGSTVPDVSLVPSGLKMFKKRLSFGKGLKLNFSGPADTSPNNFPYFMVIGYSSMGAAGTPDNQLVNCTVSCTGAYTDA